MSSIDYAAEKFCDDCAYRYVDKGSMYEPPVDECEFDCKDPIDSRCMMHDDFIEELRGDENYDQEDLAERLEKEGETL